ncbi:MAG: hypothetical protein JXQ69_06100 [Paludibacteraceae bacterium]|nr:hypothetical protein [Paludibacteraceae bacterium]MBN2787881.1 hypothetical protein [Paludibacteraceae bacterium]
MKKLLFVFGVVGLLALTSCSKEKECTCTDWDGTVTTETTDEECDELYTTEVLGIRVPTGTISCVEK